MEYPRIPYDKKKSVKLKTHDIEAIHWLFHVEKWTIPQIADRFKVLNKTIRYHLDPEYRQMLLDMTAEINKRRYYNDDEFKSLIRVGNAKRTLYRRQNDECFRKYRNHRQYEYYQTHKEYWKKYIKK